MFGATGRDRSSVNISTFHTLAILEMQTVWRKVIKVEVAKVMSLLDATDCVHTVRVLICTIILFHVYNVSSVNISDGYRCYIV